MKETVQIRWLCSAATDTRAYDKGDECEWDKADAHRLFKAGAAEPVKGEKSK